MQSDAITTGGRKDNRSKDWNLWSTSEIERKQRKHSSKSQIMEWSTMSMNRLSGKMETANWPLGLANDDHDISVSLEGWETKAWLEWVQEKWRKRKWKQKIRITLSNSFVIKRSILLLWQLFPITCSFA